MNCAEVREQLNAWLDGELPADSSSAVATHVESCQACSEVINELRQQELELLRAFQPRRSAATALGQRVATKLSGEPTGVAPRGTLWSHGFTAVLSIAAGFAAAFLLFRVDDTNKTPLTSAPSGSSDPQELTVARLVVATGPIDLRPQKAMSWQTLTNSQQRTCSPDSAVRTPPDVRCELRTSDGCVIRLNGNSSVTLRTGRLIEIESGQIWCSTPPGVSLEVVPHEPSASADRNALSLPVLTCPASTSCFASVVSDSMTQVTAAAGQLQIRTPGGSQTVSQGQTATIDAGRVSVVDGNHNQILASTWMHPLLALKGHGDDDLQVRVDQMLAELGYSKMSHLYEQEIRGLGEYSVLPLLRFVQSPISREQPERRATALRILTDVAPTWTIPDFIELLSDTDGLARMHAALALQRLTTQTFGCDAQTWRDGGESCAQALELWRAWWAENKAHSVPDPRRTTEA